MRNFSYLSKFPPNHLYLYLIPMIRYLLLFYLFFLSSFGYSQQVLQLGIVTDIEAGDRLTYISQTLQQEIQKTIGSAYQLVVLPANTLYSGFDLDRASRLYDSLTRRCDLVILFGGVSIKGAQSLGSFPIPTIGLGVLSTKFQEIPITPAGSSGVENFSYILTTQDLQNELINFKELTDFQHLGLIFDSRTAEAFNGGVAFSTIQAFADSLGITISLIGLGSDLNQDLQEISPDIDAAYLAISYERPEEDIAKISQRLIDHKLPSFSMSKQHLEQGIMACISDDNGPEQIFRKIAIMVDDILRGDSLANMRVSLNYKENLFLNRNTMLQVNFSPSFEVLYTATLIGTPPNNGPTFSLTEIIKHSISENLAIQISMKDLERSGLDLRYAKTQFLPDVDFSSNFVQIDELRASAGLGQAQSTFSGSATVSQVLYSEQLIASIRFQEFLQIAQGYATDQQILDIILDTYNAYFGILQAKANLAIQEENLTNSRTNLELARIQANLGSASLADVYRWEGEVANANQKVIEAVVGLNISKFQINNLLNNRLPLDFQLEELSLDGPIYQGIANAPLAQKLDKPSNIGKLIRFLSQEASQNYPSKNQLLANQDLLDRQQLMNQRLYYTPNVALQGGADQAWWRGGTGSDIPAIKDPTWNVALNLSYPIFDGNRRAVNIQQTQVDQEQLNLQIQSLDLNLALAVQANVLNLVSSNTNIHFSQISSENTQKNYDLVQINYQKGLVPIVQLLDAQQAALQTKLNYTLSVYTFLSNYVQLENTIGFYSLLSSEEENASFNERLIQFMIQQNNE